MGKYKCVNSECVWCPYSVVDDEVHEVYCALRDQQECVTPEQYDINKLKIPVVELEDLEFMFD